MDKKFGLAIILSLLIYTIIVITKNDSLINTLYYYHFNNTALFLEMIQIFARDYLVYVPIFGNNSITNISIFSSAANDLKVNILLTYVPFFMFSFYAFNRGINYLIEKIIIKGLKDGFRIKK